MARARPVKPISAELEAALQERRGHRRFRSFCDYSLHPPDPNDLPILRRALKDPEIGVVNCAVISLGKLRARARDAVDDLFEVARKPGPPEMGMPQHMESALSALARIAPKDPRMLELAREGLRISNYGVIKAAVEALVALRTPEALQTLRQMDRYWGTSRKSRDEDVLVNKAIDAWTGVKAGDEQPIEHRGAVLRCRSDGSFRVGVYCPKCDRPMTSIMGKGPYQCRQCGVRAEFGAQELEQAMAEVSRS